MKQFKIMGMVRGLLCALSLFSTTALAAPFDQQFIDSMVPHHQMAADMAKMALKKASRPEVKRMARKVIAAQSREIAQMKAWRKAWYPKAAPMMNHQMNGAVNNAMSGMDHSKMGHAMPKGAMKMSMNMGGVMMGLPMKMKMDMGKLASSKRFDSDFLKMMVPHHASAIVMAQEALDTTARPQLRKLSHQIIDSQAKEIGEMRALHRRLFGPL